MLRKKYLAWVLALSVSLAVFGSVYAEEQTEQTEENAASQNAEVPADGVYKPDGFSWSGGSGRVEITCDEVEIRDGQAYAAVTFSSTSYEYVKVDGEKYFGTSDEQTTTFSIPVALNTNVEIIGLTTKMSTPHEITYTIYVGLNGEQSAADRKDSGEASDSGDGMADKLTGLHGLDQTAPEILGLTALGEIETDSAEYFKLYQYEQDIVLLEIGGENATARYLIVPEDASVPAGLEKEMTVIRQPVEHAYICSEPMRLYAAENQKMLGKIAAVGMISDQCTIDAVSDAMIAGDIVYAGSWKDPDYQKLLKAGCDLVVLPAEALDLSASDEAEEAANAETEQIQEAAGQVREYFDTLGIPVVTERSADEKDEASQAEWRLVYDLLLGVSENK